MVETFSVSELIDTFNDIFPNVNILEMGHFLKYNFPSKIVRLSMTVQKQIH